MSKIVIEDIKKDRRSLREVLPSSGRSESVSSHPHQRRAAPTHDFSSDDGEDNDRPTKTRSSMTWFWGALIVTGIIVLLGYFAAPIFTTATVSITPKTLSLEINEKISAGRDSQNGDLTFTVLPEIETTFSINAPATGEKYVERKSSGKIKIVNNFSAADQPLIATTRFESVKGNIYRISEDVVVPGMKNGQPGTIDVTIYADKIGPSYNDDVTTFTIPGFAKSQKFTDITARSVTPMAGGLAGNAKVVSATTEENVRAQISRQLEKDLLDAIKAQTPDGFFTDTDLVKFSYRVEQSSENGDGDNAAVFSGVGKAVAIILNENNFTQKLVSEALNPDSAKNPIKIENLDELTVKTSDPLDGVNLAELENITLNISGKADLMWKIDQQKMIRELAGQPKKSFKNVFEGYGESILGGQVLFRPSWSKNFPTNPDKIKIELLTPNNP